MQVDAGGVDAAVGAAHGAGLGGEDDLVADLELLDQLAEQGLGVAVGVDVGRVDQRAAGVEERGQLVAGLVLVGAAGPGAGAEPEPAHPQARSAQRPQLHGGTLPRTSWVAP